ncbi:hypothetical protein [Candidatus Mycobacterium methanotrophicum]|uniref:Uncharacterized protein n=1 Tax=Candidatus Mycobacterium methanotrophicum TaxID=2943498 RepID=A0ABY4QKJ8_9MYCO|nr:hypothetical protein [Candidatus Mycobacterium methanotrophicum]UQX11562.1 hypothetical protein M5I08_03465 [Candidatus Mycobacterium methanotrophicum]
MTTPNSAAAGSATTSAWAWPLNVNHFRRRDRLSRAESDALQALDFDLLRLDRGREHSGWQAIRRLTAPLGEALAVLHWHPDTSVPEAVRPLRHRHRAAPLRRVGAGLLVVADA